MTPVGGSSESRRLCVTNYHLLIIYRPSVLIKVRMPSKTLATIGVLLFAQIALNSRIQSADSAYVELPQSHERWNPDLFRTLSFGHMPAAVDWLLLRFLLDPAYSHVSTDTRASVFYELDLATELDPLFYDLYVVGGSFLAVARNDGEGARRILEKGEKVRRERIAVLPASFRERFWPSEWQIPLALGYVYIFEKDDLPKGAAIFSEASKIPGAPAYLGHFAERMRQPGGVFQVGFRLLQLMIETTKSEEARVRLITKRESLRVAEFLFQVNSAFGEFLKQSPGVSPSAAWKRFSSASGHGNLDPWGGKLVLSDAGKILSSTPHEKVLGIE